MRLVGNAVFSTPNCSVSFSVNKVTVSINGQTRSLSLPGSPQPPEIYAGSGSPTTTAAKEGSLYIRVDAGNYPAIYYKHGDGHWQPYDIQPMCTPIRAFGFSLAPSYVDRNTIIVTGDLV